MKLSQLKRLNEAITGSTVEAADLKDKRFVDKLANELHDNGFPDTFKLDVKLSNGHVLPTTWKLTNKSINDSPTWHQLTFAYEPDHESSTRKFDYLRHAEKDDNDPEGETYDELQHDLNFDMLEVMAELRSDIEKVYGHLT